ncbi:glycosyltransferase [Moorena sp. SIO4A5]|uniref:glycosyltransferase n=1 Tax=Moorena sp. SIO4A5 TaxID=2607838 RepID=UPI0013CDDA7F|nr:glycosyltransferase [Moorena sp. SIO4A5]NEO21428.1 glycosyltransferase family 4 protein [Moorena sp. SIO4A5]
MKIIQVPFCFYPDPVGGTEIYVEALSSHLQQQGLDIIIVAPSSTNQIYHHQALPVQRFAVSSTLPDLRNLYGLGDPQAAQNFSQILDREKPDLIHLHAFTSGVSLRLVRAAKQLQIPIIFTYHTPTVSCQRGTLLKNGTQICSGKLDRVTCTSCTLQGMGMGAPQAQLIGKLPPKIGHSLGALGLWGGVWTALRMSELMECRQQAFYNLMSEVDHIIAVCDWVKQVLLLNQVAEDRITVLRQGLCHPVTPAHPQASAGSFTLKLVFLGRLDPTKGVHLLIQALSQVPDLPVTLDIYGISQATIADPYQQQLQTLAHQDTRIHFQSPVASTEVVQTIANYDLLAVPSQCLETGPLVVLEAFAAGIPVIGSRLGGIAELVQDGVNGILVEPTSVEAWAEKIRDLCGDRSQLTHLRSGILPPQDMQTVAKHMRLIYQAAITKLISQNS